MAPEPSLPAPLFVAGFLASAVFGFTAIRFLLAYLRTHSLRLFGVYLEVLGTALLAIGLAR